ncbi:MAG: hypothetical protein AB1941_23415 [Gemmatimonadota bacterium]
MGRSLFYLRRGLLGFAFVGCMGFGVTQAFAAGNPMLINQTCNFNDPEGSLQVCGAACYEAGYSYGFCSQYGYCECRKVRAVR